MKIFALFLLAAMLPAGARAQESIRIERVGLQGYFSASLPTPVRIHIPALAQSQTIRLLFRVETGDLGNPSGWRQTDEFEKQVQVTSGEPLGVDIPILFPAGGDCNLRIVGIDAQGRTIGEDKSHRGLRTRNGGPLVAIYCREDSACFQAQSQISPVRTDENNSVPTRNVQFLLLRKLESNWLVYRAADAVVIAGSISDMTSEQARALEYYLRSGGILVILEKEAANNSFLASYRQGTALPEPFRAGKGYFCRVSSLESNELTSVFSAPLVPRAKTVPNRGNAPTSSFSPKRQPRRDILTWVNLRSGSAVGSVLDRIGAYFTFPRLRWLLVWVSLYILILGPANFTILKRLRKLEWGWVTMSVTALLFAAGLYINSSSHRPKHFTLDGASVYWMDGQSPVAYEELGFRISSPNRTQVKLTINDDVLLASTGNFQWGESSGEYLGGSITGQGVRREGWKVQLAPPLILETSMRRWSLKDFHGSAFHEFSGTVHWTSAARLKNDTGRRFREGIYLDLPAHKQYLVPGMGPGEEVDLARIIQDDTHATNDAQPFIAVTGHTRVKPANQSFSLQEWLGSGLDLFPAEHIFAGILEPAGINAGLDAEGSRQQNVAVAIVALDQP